MGPRHFLAGAKPAQAFPRSSTVAFLWSSRCHRKPATRSQPVAVGGFLLLKELRTLLVV